MRRSVIFFFAHQDDEFGVFERIRLEVAEGSQVFCLYLTSGARPGCSPRSRNFESARVLSQLGVDSENVHFVGEHLAIADGDLIIHLNIAAKWIADWLQSINNISLIYIPAWEGGHPDHDCLHAVLVNVCSQTLGSEVLRQFSLYNANGCSWKFFRVLAPLQENGTVEYTHISLRNRLKFLGLTFIYRSQLMSWLGIFPFLLIHYVCAGTQSIQQVNINCIFNRPHGGRLYYETRKFSTWESVRAAITNFYSDTPAVQDIKLS